MAPERTRDRGADSRAAGDAFDEHFSKLAGRYDSLDGTFPLSWIRGREAVAVAVLMGRLDGQEVLDLGRGSGAYTGLCLDLGSRHVVAVDRSADMIASLPRSERVSGVVADAESYAPDRRFDRIVRAGMLEFVPDAGVVLAALRGLAADGARALLVLARGGFWGALYRRYHRARGVAVRCFSLAEIEGMCAASGWELEAHRAVWPLVHVRRLAATSKQGRAG